MSLVCVVIPTRNRPSFLRAALNSLVNQSDHDFSVVVSDNSDDDESGSVCREFSNKLKLRYQRADRTLSMVDNWNFGLSGANAEFVAVMIDKTVWNPGVVRTVRKTVQDFGNVNVISWGNEAYYGDSEGCGAGLYVPNQSNYEPAQQVDLLEKLRERREFKVSRVAQTSSFYCLGKICFGVYSAVLIDRIRSRHNSLFHPLSPDYTSLTLASLYSTNAIQLGAPMQLSFQISTGSGGGAARNPWKALDYLQSVDPQLACLSRLPVPGLYQSAENCCAFDLVQFDDVSEIVVGGPNLISLRGFVIDELADSGNEIDCSFMDTLECYAVHRQVRRARTTSRISRSLLAIRRALVSVVRLWPRLYELLKSFQRNTSVQCSSPGFALNIQDTSNYALRDPR